jgi:hypothetical protein
VHALEKWQYADDSSFGDYHDEGDEPADWDAAWKDLWLQKWRTFHINQKKLQSEAMQEGRPYVGLTDVPYDQYAGYDAAIVDLEQRATYSRLYNDMNRRSYTSLQFFFASMCVVTAVAWMIVERGRSRKVARAIAWVFTALGTVSYIDTQPCTRGAYARATLHGFGRLSLRPFRGLIGMLKSYFTWVRASQRPCEVFPDDPVKSEREYCLHYAL